jgi:ATP-dependent Clp protease ATP-binding subunit ClpB
VVLLDEVEKAHPDVFHVLLQVLDDGRITDSQGRTVDFKNTLVIMTSNIGSSYLLEGIDAAGHVSESAQQAVMGELRRHFRPEFLNRLDDVVFFKPLTETEIGKIVGLMVDELRERLAERRISIELSPEAVERIVQEGYDPVYGARPLRRYIQRHLETLIARALIGGGIPDGARVTVGVTRDAGSREETLVVDWDK